MMNLSDFLIIYLACGTPFAMYHFINNRKVKTHRLKAILVFIVWIPYALWLFRLLLLKNFSKLQFAENQFSGSELDEKIEKSKKALESFLLKNYQDFPIFEFREIIERYIGLTFAVRLDNKDLNVKERELLEITNHENKLLAARCLYRRNQKLLVFHHTLARRDFLKFIFEHNISDQENFYHLLFEFISFLNDKEAENVIKSVLTSTPQSEKDIIVKQLETEKWKPEIQKQTHTQPITIRSWRSNQPTS